MNWNRTCLVAITLAAAFTLQASAVVVPFTEPFDTTANWADAALNPLGLTLHASGGPDGSSYISQDFSFQPLADGDTPVLFRAHDEFGSSGGAFVGDWIANQVGQFSAMVRHNLPVPVNYFVRFSGPANFPGAVGVDFVPVLPNTWTQISVTIDPASPQFVSFEGSDFDTVFSSVGHVQLGPSVPTGFGGNPANWTFDVDQASIVAVPEPGLTLGVGLSLALLVAFRRR